MSTCGLNWGKESIPDIHASILIYHPSSFFLKGRAKKGGAMDLYLWVKAAHVISVIAWMAGLFYLPRLYVYHVEQRAGVPQMVPVLETMERRLLRGIMNPAMIATWIFGLALIAMGAVDWSDAWPWVKAVAVLAMTWFHMWCARQRKGLMDGSATVTGRGYRIMNEVPTLLLIAIVVAVIVKF
jgi:putative membrane protein